MKQPTTKSSEPETVKTEPKSESPLPKNDGKTEPSEKMATPETPIEEASVESVVRSDCASGWQHG